MGWTGLVFLLVFTPHLVVTGLSFFTWTMDVPHLPVTLANYEALGRRSLSPVLVSYALAIVSTLAAVLVGVLVAYVVVRKAFVVLGPGLNALVMLPYLIPGTVLAVGLIVAFSRPPLALTGTGAILAIAYFIRKLPYAMKSAEAALYQVHPSLEEAALSVGATPARAFRDVTVRLILPALASGATVTFLATITELSATIMLYSAAWTTMTVVIFQAAQGMGGQFGVGLGDGGGDDGLPLRPALPRPAALPRGRGAHVTRRGVPVRVGGIRKRTERSPPSTTSRWTSRPAGSRPCSGRPAAARPRCSASSRGSWSRTRAPSTWAAATSERSRRGGGASGSSSRATRSGRT